MTRRITWLSLLLLAAAQIGCTCTPQARARAINVRLADTLAQQSARSPVEVDLVFVLNSEVEDWRMDDNAINRYFGGADDRRNVASKLTALFPAGGQTTFERTKMQVEDFVPPKSMMHLVILAHLPQGRADQKFVPMDKCLWEDRKPSIKSIDVTVGPEEITVLPFDGITKPITD